MSHLHWYGPKSHNSKHHPGDSPLRRARYKLCIPDDQYQPGSTQMGRDKHGTWIWIGTDCGWEWLETRPGIYRMPWSTPFRKLCEHVHTPGAW